MISLNTIPGLGKSATSRTAARNASVGPSVAEGNLRRPRGLNHLTFRIDATQPINRMRNRNIQRQIVLIAYHRAKFFLRDELDSFIPKRVPRILSSAVGAPVAGGRERMFEPPCRFARRFHADDFGDAAEAVFSARGGMTMLSAGAWGGSSATTIIVLFAPTLSRRMTSSATLS